MIARLACVLLLAGTGQANELEELVEGLARGTSSERREVVAALAGRGPEVLGRMQRVARYDVLPARRAAAADVARALGPRALPALKWLLGMLSDAASEPRIAAAQAIAAIGPAAREGRLELKAYQKRVSDQEARWAFLALAAIHEKDTEFHQEIFENRSEATWVAQLILDTGPFAEPLVRGMLRSTDPHVRVSTLMEVTFRKGAPPYFLRLLEERVEKDKEPQVVDMACRSLAFYAEASSRPFARRQLTRKEPIVRATACAILGHHAAEPGDVERMCARVGDDDERVRGYAIAALRQWKVRDESLEADLHAYIASEDSMLREQAALLLLEMGERNEWAMRVATIGALRDTKVPWQGGPFRRRGTTRVGLSWPAIKRWELVSATDVLRSTGSRAWPIVEEFARGMPARAVTLLGRFGEPTRTRVEAYLASEEVEARISAMFALMARGDRRTTFGALLVRELRVAVKRRHLQYDHIRDAFVALGEPVVPSVLAEVRQHAWVRGNGRRFLVEAIAEALERIGGPEVEKLGEFQHDRVTWILGR
ncbi:MAG: HEAT repeat domain-containing protein [Planctomycetota bacterium]